MDKKTKNIKSLPGEILTYYERGEEDRRLVSGFNQLEKARTEELLDRLLPVPPAVVLDVGGGSGHYACWIAKKGYEVHLIDPVPLHVDQALQASMQQPDHPLASVVEGDARRLEQSDNSTDVVLLFGPLYHLTEWEDRQKVDFPDMGRRKLEPPRSMDNNAFLKRLKYNESKALINVFQNTHIDDITAELAGQYYEARTFVDQYEAEKSNLFPN